MVIFATKTKKHIKDMIEQGETKETLETTKTATTQTNGASKETQQDERFMRAALAEAQAAYDEGEIPVGAVIVAGGRIIARAHNLRESGKNAIYHAELLAIDAACKALGGWRLWQCELFVTLEPCPMCSGAIINSRLKRVVYGARDPKAGCCGSLTDLFALPFNHHPVMEQGLLEEEAQALLQEFFAGLRAKRLKLKAEKRAQQAAPLQNEENPHE